MPLDYSRFDKIGSEDSGSEGQPEERKVTPDNAGHRVLEVIREQIAVAERKAAEGNLQDAVRIYDDASKMLLSLQDAKNEAALQAADLRTEALGVRLRAAKTLSVLGDWKEAELRANAAIDAAMLEAPEARAHLAELDLLPCDASDAPSDQGYLAHRDAADAFLCRARARLQLGDPQGALQDASTARAMARQLDDGRKEEMAESFLAQAQLSVASAARSNSIQGSHPRVTASGSATEERQPVRPEHTKKDYKDCTVLSKMPRPDEIPGLVLGDLD
eukprot:TRINITY_DN54353_c0_g1_i1.p1 TRINITY_DN54353_c0_g1~~TRINITY_DN54353_c0_g1_i1.p1  ORF type:complete len:275 (-),score=85.36 TRINITY_DN54353_c0_g1_i1:94-918(-)